MKLLFVHQNFPGQFRHLAPALAARRGHEVVALAIRPDPAPLQWNGVRLVPYQVTGRNAPGIHRWVLELETKALRAEACWRAARALRDEGFSPEAIVAHPGWGEALFLKQVWPAARLGLYAELFYQAEGADADFDPEFAPPHPDAEACRLQMKNLNHLAQLQHAHAALSPTHWQADTFPAPWRERIHVAHDGIDTEVLRPLASARLALPDGSTWTRDDEVITYVSRHLEPYRGFHIFMRALPSLLRARPQAHVVIVGDDGVGYGAGPPEGTSWRQVFTAEVRGQIPDADWSRVHFVPRLAREDFTALLQVSRVHVYLSYPFVLSWSLLEAMSVGCCIVASDTAPVREAIASGEHGQLVDFFDVHGLVRQICDLLEDGARRQLLGTQARQRAQERYDLKTVCLPAQLAWLDNLVHGTRRLERR